MWYAHGIVRTTQDDSRDGGGRECLEHILEVSCGFAYKDIGKGREQERKLCRQLAERSVIQYLKFFSFYNKATAQPSQISTAKML